MYGSVRIGEGGTAGITQQSFAAMGAGEYVERFDHKLGTLEMGAS